MACQEKLPRPVMSGVIGMARVGPMEGVAVQVIYDARTDTLSIVLKAGALQRTGSSSRWWDERP